MNHPTLWTLGVSALLGLSQPATAHIQYYDLNQGKQISDLTPAGKAASTVQYGANPVVPPPGVGALSTVSDRPLNNAALWNASYQVYTGVGIFSGVAYSPDSSAAKVVVNDVTDWGWGEGTQATLGNTHEVDFFNFRLQKASTVTITWNIDDGMGDSFDGGFTLFRGVASYQAHDDSLDPLQPTTGIPPKRVQNALDTGAVFDAQGIASAYRNTLTNAAPYVGQFNALGNWGDSNGAGNWSNVSYVQAVNAKNPADGYSTNAADTLETLTIDLAAGNYTIAASGALGATAFGSTTSYGISGLTGVLTFKATALPATPVPVPAALWLFGSALFGLGGRRVRARRRG
jgi:hypothetical protein